MQEAYSSDFAKLKHSQKWNVNSIGFSRFNWLSRQYNHTFTHAHTHTKRTPNETSSAASAALQHTKKTWHQYIRISITKPTVKISIHVHLIMPNSSTAVANSKAKAVISSSVRLCVCMCVHMCDCMRASIWVEWMAAIQQQATNKQNE